MNVDMLISLLMQEDKDAEVVFNAEKEGVIYNVDDVFFFSAENEVVLTGEKQ